MKTIQHTLSILLIGLVFVSCSSVKVTDSWNDIEKLDLEDKEILILNKTDNNVLRQQFESDLVNELKKQGYSSKESYTMFPSIKTDVTYSDDELKSFKEELTKTGIDVVVMTVLKDINEYTKTETTGGSTYYINTYPRMVYRGYYRGFYRSYGTVYIDDRPLTTKTYTHKNYVLETLVYDLTQPEEKQLSSVITSVVENPESMGTTSNDFSKKVVKELLR